MKRLAVTPTTGKSEVRTGEVPRKRGVFDLQGHFLECGTLVRQIHERLMDSSDVKALMAAAHIMQRQIALEARVMETATRAQGIMEFQSAVLEALEGEGVEVQRRIIGMFEGEAGRG